ncbi:Fc.00g108130.m01.CDS01 [Cosmosporella sp. VM-42]
MTGFLIPEDYVFKKPSANDMNVASIAWGFSLGVCIFTGAKGLRQTINSWKRGRKMNIYVILLWTEWASSAIMSAITWSYLREYIEPGFPVFFVIVFLWAIQIQTLMQIIINRIAILMMVRQNARKLKVAVFLILLAINVSVFCVWIPARLQINSTYIHVNSIWDRIEKCVFLVIDACLNLYFIHLVKSRLVANGLTKYNRLFRFNLGMITISITMDVLLIAMMSLPNDIVYLQFHPLAYLVKLHIEMNMADLITKVVKASNPTGYHNYSNSQSRSAGKSSKGTAATGSKKIASMFAGGNTTFIEAGGDDIELPTRETGIQKTTTTQVVIKPANQSGDYDDHDFASESSSTRQLKREHYAV